jgi:hypothetical protein
MTTTARIPLVHTGPFVSAMSWYSRRAYGDVLEPGLAMAHNRKVLLTSLRRERSVEHWDGPRRDPQALGGDGRRGDRGMQLVHGLRVLGFAQ